MAPGSTHRTTMQMRALRRSKGFSTRCGGRRIIGSGFTAGVGQAQSQPRRLIAFLIVTNRIVIALLHSNG